MSSRASCAAELPRRRGPLERRAAFVAVAVGLAIGCLGLVAAPAAALRLVARSTISGPVGLAGPCRATVGANNPLIVADPRDPRRLVATYLVGSTGAGVGAVAAVSRDAGRSWKRVAIRGMTPCEGGSANLLSDPYLAFGPDGHVYFDASGIGVGSDPAVDNVYLAASGNRGANFARATRPLSGRSSQRGPLSPHPGHPGSVALEYESFDPGRPLGSVPGSVGVAGSRDGGARFAVPSVFERSPVGSVGLAVGLLRSRQTMVTLSADVNLAQSGAYVRGVPGSLLVEHVAARRSRDDGKRFGRPTRVGELVMRLDDPGGCCLISSSQAPDGTLYATWTEPSGPAGGEVLLFVSRDHGASWKRLRVVATATRAFQSSVAVAPDGSVGVLWLQGAPGAGGAKGATNLIARLASSPNHGHSWSTLTLTAPIRPAIGVNLADGGSLGEYQGITGLPAGFGIALTTVHSATARAGATIVQYLRIAA